MSQVVLIAHNLRSTHNVGSLLRTADGLGAIKTYLTGYTPYPLQAGDKRMPHLAAKIARSIHKTALGAEDFVDWEHTDDILPLISNLHADGYLVCALEQAKDSISLSNFDHTGKVALLVGREVEGVEQEVLVACDQVIEIPMKGRKESFNVAQAAAMALYQLLVIGG